MSLDLPRRKFLTAAAALFCAPAIVRASSLMPVRAVARPMLPLAVDFAVDPEIVMANISQVFYCNRTIREYIDLKTIRDRNVLLPPEAYPEWCRVR